MKQLPIGIESFSKIIQNGYYYIDKTNMIRDLLNSKSEVTLFTRPRRFGKSLNMDMLKTFLRKVQIHHFLMGLPFQRRKNCVKNTRGNIL